MKFGEGVIFVLTRDDINNLARASSISENIGSIYPWRET